MIKLSKLTSNLQDALNGLDTDVEFKLYADMGDFFEAYRELGSNVITHFRNGVVEALAPTIMPIKNLQVITQSFRVQFILDADLLDKDEDGNYAEVEKIRNLLDKYIVSANGIPYVLLDDDNVSFEITPTFSGVTIGVASQLSPIGNALPMYLDFSCVFVQNGVNTNSVEFIINGENVLFQSYSATRTRVAEANMMANEKSQKSVMQANGISIHLEMPLLTSNQSRHIEKDVYSGGQNEAVCVQRRRRNNDTPIEDNYIMTYGNNSESGGLGQNIGQVVDFVEGKPDNLIYGINWTNQTITTQNENESYSLTFSTPIVEGGSNVVVFWGDGQSKSQKLSTSSTTTLSHTYDKIGTYTIRIFKY